MHKPLCAILLSGLMVSACGFRESRINPFNWFGKSEETVITERDTGPVNPLLPDTGRRNGMFSRPDAVYQGALIGQVSDLAIERTDDGAIIRVTGLADRQGPHDVRLVPKTADGKPDEKGVLAYEFRVVYPRYSTPVGPERARRVTAAVSLGNRALSKVRVVRVEAAQNARESRRR